MTATTKQKLQKLERDVAKFCRDMPTFIPAEKFDEYSNKEEILAAYEGTKASNQ